MMERIEGLARNSDPETSQDAAASVEASKLVEKIYEAMNRYGEAGCISDDIGRDLPGVGVQTYTPRFKQMIERGMIEATGEKRKGDCGRYQLVRRCLPKPFQRGLALVSRARPGNRVAELEAQIEAVKNVIKDCRDSWAPDQPPYDIRQLLIDLDSVLENKANEIPI